MKTYYTVHAECFGAWSCPETFTTKEAAEKWAKVMENAGNNVYISEEVR